MKSFFDKNYQTPLWCLKKDALKKATKEKNTVQQGSRRRFLKSAAGASAIIASPAFALTTQNKELLAELTKSDPWLTLDATLMHLLPASSSAAKTGPSAKDINALAYLHQIMTVQPTAQEEKDFIFKGVGWLNGFSQTQKNKPFVQLSFDEKELILRGISNSSAGENWLSTLLSYLQEAMLSPPSYGGNTDGVGWQWLEHQAGFPLPKVGQRYFELPPRSKVKNEIVTRTITTKSDSHLAKAPSIKRVSKA